MLFCRLLIFSKSTFWKYSFRNNVRVSNSSVPDQARQIVRPDLGPNCLQRLSADDTSYSTETGLNLKHFDEHLTCYLKFIEPEFVL